MNGRAKRLLRSDPGSSAVVHVVDDEPDMCGWLSDLLRTVGYQVVTHVSAEEFLANYQEATSDCLILDLRLPGMSGLELQAELAHERILEAGPGTSAPRVLVFLVTAGGVTRAEGAVSTQRLCDSDAREQQHAGTRTEESEKHGKPNLGLYDRVSG